MPVTVVVRMGMSMFMIVGMSVIMVVVMVMNRERHVAVGVNMFMHMWAGMAAAASGAHGFSSYSSEVCRALICREGSMAIFCSSFCSYGEKRTQKRVRGVCRRSGLQP